MADVFVSYSHEDEGVAQSIMDAIEQAGIAVFRVPKGGSSSAQMIREQFKSAPCVVWLWSRSAAHSTVMLEEIQDAVRAWSEGRLVLATIDDAPLPIGLRDLQGIPVRKAAAGLDAAELLEAVRELVELYRAPPLASAPPPAAPPPATVARSAAVRPRRIAMPLILVSLLLVAGSLGWMMMTFGQSPRDAMKDKAPIARPTMPAPRPDVVAPPPPVAQPPKQTAEAPAPQAGPPASTPARPSPPTVGADKAAPPPSGPAPKVAPPPITQQVVPSDGLWVIAVMLVAGIAIGAGSVWAWSLWGRRRAEPMPALSQNPPTPAIPAAAIAAPVHQVFVSYSRQDGSAVEALVKHIEQLGYTVWIDRHSSGSQRYAAPIVRAIKTSQLVALMCSQNAFGSDHVIREVYVAGDYKKPFIAFQLDQSEFPDDVLYFVSGFPRVRTDALDVQQLRSEIARLVAA